MIRPTGVTVIAILFFIGAGILVLLALGALLGGSFFGAMLGGMAGARGSAGMGATAGFVVGAVLSVGFVIGAVLDAVTGYGLWAMKNWGRILALVLCIIAIVFAIPGLFLGLAHFAPIGFFWHIVRLAIAAVIVWYLLQPQVKAAFDAANVPAYRPQT